jgi:hypothetical protein
MATVPPVKGHGLQREGRAFDADRRHTGKPEGYGLCACDALSPLCTTTAARQRWHREHKAEIRARKEAR